MAFYYSEYFRNYVTDMLVKNVPYSIDLIFAYTLLIKAKNYSVDYLELGNLLGALKNRIVKHDLLKSEEHI